jgi:hypothetical protein
MARRTSVVIGRTSQTLANALTDTLGVSDSVSRTVSRLMGDGMGLSDAISVALSGAPIDGRIISAANTGYTGLGATSGNLTNHAGGNVSASLSRRKFTAPVVITGNNVTLSECWFSFAGGSTTNPLIINGNNAVVTYCTIAPSDANSFYNCILPDDNSLNCLIQRCDVSKGNNIISINGGYGIIEECYLHDTLDTFNADPHKDNIEMYGNDDIGWVIRNNRLKFGDGGVVSNINCAPWFNPAGGGPGATAKNNTIGPGNWLSGSARTFTVGNGGSNQGVNSITNFKIFGNFITGDNSTFGAHSIITNSDGRTIAQTITELNAHPTWIYAPAAQDGANAPNVWYGDTAAGVSPSLDGQVVTF